jgi:chromosome partitioning protein
MQIRRQGGQDKGQGMSQTGPHLVVLGNEKGGSGKSTTAMHLATALARAGRRVGVIDLDLRQRSLGRYLENRAAYSRARALDLPGPIEARLPPEAPDPDGLARALASLAACDVVVIDCPGAHTPLAQAAHALADTLLTPLNDSFVDFDLLARVDPDSGRVLGPSVYAEMVWQARQARAAAGRRALDWVVLRNRLGAQAMRNKRRMADALDNLGKRIGFRIVPGLSDRVIYRELFPRGLTLLDLHQAGTAEGMNLAQVAARQEVRDLVAALALPPARAAA